MQKIKIFIFISLAFYQLFAVAGDDAKERLIYFSVDSSLALANEVMQVELVATSQNAKANMAAEAVNAAIHWGLKEIKKHPQLEVSTEGYRSDPVYAENSHNSKLIAWRASQKLLIKSSDFAVLGNVLATLQQKLQIQNTHMRPSEQSQKQAHNQLLVRALEKFKQRARLIQKTMGASAYKLIELRVHNHAAMPMMYAQDKMLANNSAPVAIEAGNSTMNMSLDASIELLP